MLVVNLQNAVMKTRMQPIGRLFNKYPRLARDLARQLGKDVELVLFGEETEIDKTMIEDLNDPPGPPVRNAVDHGVEDPAQRAASASRRKAWSTCGAARMATTSSSTIQDDGKGMRPDASATSVEKGLIGPKSANSLDDRKAWH